MKNSTSLSHSNKMKMASKECQQLESQGLIEDTNSPWACHAFYVNNRAEQTRGRQRVSPRSEPETPSLKIGFFTVLRTIIEDQLVMCGHVLNH
ncbi:hypothetical protein CsatB_014703 [Cannabis sativa]